jgi:CxxC-x17-CxxC domain-containing protein
MSFEDKTITCVDCGQPFVHSAEDQSRYAERGFTNEPKRCRDCREKRKKTGGAGGAGGARGPARRPGGSPGNEAFGNRGGDRPFGGARGGAGGPRESFEAVCAECGATTTVPFKPTQGRPVYCRDCFRSKRG